MVGLTRTVLKLVIQSWNWNLAEDGQFVAYFLQHVINDKDK